MTKSLQQKQNGSDHASRRVGATRGVWKALAAMGLLTLGAQVGAGATNVPFRVTNDCVVCHGVTGTNTIYPEVPRLAGQHKAYLKLQLQEFKSHERADQNGKLFMWPVAQGLDKAQINQLATYFAAQKPAFHTSGVHHAGVAAGKDIFNNGVASAQIPACSACHGANGDGASTFPQIAGQRYQYIIQQLTYFHNGTRSNMLMNSIAKNITKAQMKEVAAYLSSL